MNLISYLWQAENGALTPGVTLTERSPEAWAAKIHQDCKMQFCITNVTEVQAANRDLVINADFG